MQETKDFVTIDESALAAITQIKEKELQLLSFIKNFNNFFILDTRWHHIAITHLEEGFMAFMRCLTISKPKPIKDMKKM